MAELMNAGQAQGDEISRLYLWIRRNPDFLHSFDKQPFADTPLHLAAGEGKTQLALEIQRLMPSFRTKLNPDGFSPLHLALLRGHATTVTAMVKQDPQLVRVQGREGKTPLHYAAERDDVDALAQFLLICPGSIEELTIRGESAVHVAVENRSLAAVKVLVGWLKRWRREEVLGWRDFNGNTALHLAALNNQPQVIELLVKLISREDKNSDGMTALDIAMGLPAQENIRALQILKHNRGPRGLFTDYPKFSTFADYLSSTPTIIDNVMSFGGYLNIGLPSQSRDSILVVAILIVTATFQAVLTPPDIFKSTVHNETPKINNSTIGNGEVEKRVVVEFTSFNSIAFAASLGTIYIALPRETGIIGRLLKISLLFLMMSYSMVALGNMAAYRIFWVPLLVLLVFAATTGLKSLDFRKGSVWAFRRLIGSNYFYNIQEVRILLFYSKHLSLGFREQLPKFTQE